MSNKILIVGYNTLALIMVLASILMLFNGYWEIAIISMLFGLFNLSLANDYFMIDEIDKIKNEVEELNLNLELIVYPKK